MAPFQADADPRGRAPRPIAVRRETGRGKGAYIKGERRRERLLEATTELLARKSLDAISLKDIADHAKVPVGSAYHFFANAHSVYTELADRFMTQLSELISAPYSADEAESWRTIFDAAVDRAAALYARNPAYRQLIIGGKAPPEIKLTDRQNDERVGEIMIEIISRHFEFPDFPDSRDVFFYATEIVDLMFSLSVMRTGEIQPEMVEEAKKAAGAYLRQYLPNDLPARSSEANRWTL